MRVTGGRVRGRNLAILKGLDIRPSSDLVRQAIFNLIGHDISGLLVLDLFAGTGVLGIEALSRGALRALFIDKSEQAVKIIKKNLRLCGYESSGSVIKKDLGKGLPRGAFYLNRKFDLVFIDPPYGKALIPPLLKELSENDVLKPSAIVVSKSSNRDKLHATYGDLAMVNSKYYGQTNISIYHYEVNK